ncbi:nuclear transport factor 2 family protein [Mucilaginibacter litoreus]|uniref:Nuclear transport factor 2 family protein n=1 Tax=Mucilaginibacter litoreus TaxID=1048221 RepID=A0ABW3AWB9_9SPHI
MENKEEIIKNYIAAYNRFDVNAMVADMSSNIRFENISGGVVNLAVEGIEAFKEQAESAKSYFSSRHQAIQNIQHNGDETVVDISYQAVLAIDLPNGLTKGRELNLTGKSVFKFRHNKIVALTDIS